MKADEMKGENNLNMTRWLILHAAVFLNLGLSVFVFYLVKPFLQHNGWFDFFLTAAVVFLLLYGFSIVFFIYKKISKRQPPSFYRFRFVNLFILFVANGLTVFLIIQVGAANIKPMVQYLYYTYRLPYLLILAVFHGFLSVKLFQRGRGAKFVVTLRSVAGSAGTAFAVGIFLFNAAEHVSEGDNRLFPNNIIDKKSPVDFVNPIAGTREPVVHHGVLPLAASFPGNTAFAPMNQDTRRAGESYRYYNRKLTGFLLLYRRGDSGNFLTQGVLMPGAGEVKFLRKKRGLKYRHRDEISSPHYYRALLEPGRSRQISAEMVPLRGGGILRFTFSNKQPPWIIMDGGSFHGGSSELFVDAPGGEISGKIVSPVSMPGVTASSGNVSFFVLRCERPAVGAGVYDKNNYFKGRTSVKGKRVGGVLRFASSEKKTITLFFGTSSQSIDAARRHLPGSAGSNDFEKIKSRSRADWEKAFSKEMFTGTTEEEKGNFYTALYRSLLAVPFSGSSMVLKNQGKNKRK